MMMVKFNFAGVGPQAVNTDEMSLSIFPDILMVLSTKSNSHIIITLTLATSIMYARLTINKTIIKYNKFTP